MPLKPVYYMDLLGKLIETHGTELWLVNTGWLGPNVPGSTSRYLGEQGDY